MMDEQKTDMMQGYAALNDAPFDSPLRNMDPEDILMLILLLSVFCGELAESTPKDVEAMKELAHKLAEEMKEKKEG